MKKEIPAFVEYTLGAVALALAGFGLFTELDGIKTNQLAVFSPRPDPFNDIVIEAKAAFVYEPDTGRIFYAKNKDLVLPIASVTKVMTALTASELLPPSTIISFSPKRHYQVKDLVALTLISSSNDGALALASSTKAVLGRDLVKEMNAEAASLGLTQTSFANPTGLDLSETQAGAYSSASDVAHLFTYVLALQPELLYATKFPEIEAGTVEGVRHRFENTDEIVSDLPGLIASKTGFTDIAGGNLAIAFDRGLNQPVVVVVLGSSEAGRFTDMRQLVLTTLQAANLAL